MTAREPRERYSVREIRMRRWVEQRIEALGESAMRLGFDELANLAAWPLRVAPDLRPRPAIVVLSGGIRSTGQLNATSVARVRLGAALWQENPDSVFVVAGGPRRPGRSRQGSAEPVRAGLALARPGRTIGKLMHFWR